MALYSMAYPKKKVDLFFASPKDFKKFSLKDLSLYKNQLETVALSIQKLLSLSEDKYYIASLFFPNVDSWMWSYKAKEDASRIWKLK
jgi:hypothetical protein